MAVVSFADAVQDMPSPEMIEYICYCITCSMLACFITYNSTNRKKWEQSITLFYPLSGDNNICTCTVPYGDFYKVQLCNHSFISIQPYRPGWQEPEPSHVTNMALVRCILDKFLGVVCHCFPPPLDVPTFAARCLYVRDDARDPSSERWNCGREIVR